MPIELMPPPAAATPPPNGDRAKTAAPGRGRRLPGTRAAKRIYALIGIAMTFIGVYQFVWPLIRGPDPPPPLTGDLGVAIAPFAARGDATTQQEARSLSDSTYRTLSEQLGRVRAGSAGDLDIEVRGPAGLATPTGDAQARARAAGRLARTLHADVVIYGTLVARAQTTSLQPEFWINTRKVLHPEDRLPVMGTVAVPDLPAGAHAAGVITVAGRIDESPLARARLRTELAKRTRAIAQFVVGLGFYGEALAGRRGALAEAERTFAAAARSGWDPRLTHVLELFRGNVALIQRRLDEAERHYRRALAARPDFTRARLGAAETRYHLAARDCAPGRVDNRGLNASARGYRRVSADEAPAWSVLRAKAEFGLGRVGVCRALAGQASDLGEAMRHFDAVIGAVEGGAPIPPAVASEAYGGSGLVFLVRGDAGPDRALLRRSLERYGTALRLSRLAERRGAFHAVLGYLHARLHDWAAARADYRAAMRLDPVARDEYAAELRRLVP